MEPRLKGIGMGLGEEGAWATAAPYHSLTRISSMTALSSPVRAGTPDRQKGQALTPSIHTTQRQSGLVIDGLPTFDQEI